MSRESARNLHRSRQGWVFGVCRGIASAFDFPVFWVRFFAAALILFTGFWPGLILYLLAALLMKPEPALPGGDSGRPSPRANGEGLRDRLQDLDRRIRRMEDRVTSPEFVWERRLNGKEKSPEGPRTTGGSPLEARGRRPERASEIRGKP